tara:strand:- start:71 stop:418 length:348 start_codon:yes stop_codon:yes gene_type:complete
MFLVSREIARLHHPMSSFQDLPVGTRLDQPEVGSYRKDRVSGLQMPLSLCSFQVTRVDILPVLVRVDILLADKDTALPAVPRWRNIRVMLLYIGIGRFVMKRYLVGTVLVRLSLD